MPLQKHEKEAIKAIQREWPGARVTTEPRKGHQLVEVVTPDGLKASTTIACSPANRDTMPRQVVRVLRRYLKPTSEQPA